MTTIDVVDPKVLWAPLYENVLQILGPTGIILPFGDTNHEAGDFTTFTTVGGEQLVFTWSEARTSFDTALELVGPGHIPALTLNGSDEQADSPDAAYWTRISSAKSWAAWVKFNTIGDDALWSKVGLSAAEWLVTTDSAKLQVQLFDATTSHYIGRRYDPVLSNDQWYHIVATDDGSDTVGGLNLYLDGVAVDDTNLTVGSFVAEEDTAEVARLGYQGTNSRQFDGLMGGGPCGPNFAHVELTADQALRLFQLGRPNIVGG